MNHEALLTYLACIHAFLVVGVFFIAAAVIPPVSNRGWTTERVWAEIAAVTVMIVLLVSGAFIYGSWPVEGAVPA